MEQVKEKVKKMYNWDYFPIIIFTIGMLIFHMVVKLNCYDDIYFSKVLQENQLLAWTRERYATWTSRNIIETIMVIILNFNPIVWKAIDISILILLETSISKLFTSKDLRRNNWVIVAIIFLYPFKDMSTAGWAVTTINCLWPLSFGIFSLIVVKKIFNNRKIEWYEYVLSTLALIFAINTEQVCTTLLLTYGTITVYLIIKGESNIPELKSKNKFYMIFQTSLCLLSMVFILTCPGNASRKSSEIAAWFPDYNTLSPFNKLELGFSSTIAKFIFQPNLFFIMLSLLIFAVTIIKHKNKTLRVISGVPFVCSIVLGVFAYVISKVFPNIPNIVTSVTKYGTITKDNYHLIQSYIPIVLLASIGICFLISLYFCFEDKNKKILVMFIALLGIASRIVMGFSPTIWASMDRTFIYMYFSLIICAVMVYGELTETEITQLKFVNKVIGISAFISYIILIAYTIILQTFQNHENLINFINSHFHVSKVFLDLLG